MLTNILSDSLGGNNKMYILATVSPLSVDYSETLKTLNFASIASSIPIAPKKDSEKNKNKK